jgi:hypothetical protein
LYLLIDDNLVWTLQTYRNLYKKIDQLYTLLGGIGTLEYSSELTTEGHFKAVLDSFDERVMRLINEAGLRYSPDIVMDYLHEDIPIDTILNHSG